MGSSSILLLALLSSVGAQQLNGTYTFVDFPGLSQGCKTALNTSVTCPLFLGRRSISSSVLDRDAVNALCVDSCYNSLKAAKTKIVSACSAATDKITFDVGVQPASYIVDNYIFAYDVSCRKDSTTGQFCDPTLLEWSQRGGGVGANETCSDCWLGGQALQLNNPLGYDEAFASDFASLTSSCGAQGKYPLTPISSTTTTPASVTTSPPTITPVCSGTYTLSAADEDCNSVARSLQVSTYNLLIANGIDLYCQNFYPAIESGATLCVPERCPTYTWQASDTCESLVLARPNITVTQFLAWNPNFNSLCRNGLKFVGYEVCVGPPGGSSPPTNTTGLPPPATSITAPIPAPTNAEPGSSKPCGRWYTVSSGDECATVSLANGLSLDDLYFLNPGLKPDCSNLMLGVAYCVAPAGDIATYPGHPTSTPTGPWATISVPPVTLSPVDTRVTAPTSHPGFVATATPALPTASGTAAGCAAYRNYIAVANDAAGTSALNSCGYLESAYDVSVEQLRRWNPSLAAGAACALQPGLSYCVQGGPGSSSSSSSTSVGGGSSGSPTATTASPPAPTQTGVVDGCQQFYVVQSGDSCWAVQDKFGITFEQMLRWNPSIGSNCENLWLGYAYCVKGP